MKRLRGNILLFLAMVFLSGSMVHAQDDEVTFTMNLSKEKLGINERLRVDFTMNKDGDNFTPPAFENFKVVMGPSQSISSSWINGKRTFSKTYTYILLPTARGNFTIQQATIEIAGETYKTTPKTVEVTAAVDRPNGEKTVDDVADESLHLVAEVSKDNPYLNEAVTVVYKLYVSPDISVTNYRPLDNPTYNNFWSQDIPVTKHTAQNGTYEGKPFRYVVLKRVVLYPQKSGQLEIEPLSLEIFVDVPTNRRDFFGGRIYTQTSKTVSAGNRTINVKPLPEAGKPVDFSGAVGDFEFSVTTSKDQLNASESLQAKVEISGKGNLKLFQLPKPELPSSLEVYDPEHEEDINTYSTGMEGKVVDNYTIVPSFRGKYPIPSIPFSYFNPATGKYVTLHSDEINIEVMEGPVSSADNLATGSSTNKQLVVPTGKQFHFLKLNPNLGPLKISCFFGSKAFYMWLFLPLLLIPLAILVFKKREAMASDVIGNKIKQANRLAKKYLSAAKRDLGNKEAFYVALEKGLHNYLKAKLNIETTEFSKEKITGILKGKQVDQEDIQGFIGLLTSCEMARYSPYTQVQMQNDYDKASEVISKLDKQL
ncbi:BatD family protein [Flagellimonas pelagia]|uniref:Protein BatD n=1 Tax=Flagellimonas pelagia TaxID=2306998 RepID=A0A3A1NIR5_9FLAO|nr:BatD family protein [Allomuricauda maritima]RIV43940.1 protein BatD [Allomuricauda maritima]TXJ93845.1 protein BatD [Allomuricauda maritima]